MWVCVWFLLKFNMILTQSQLRKKQVHENGKAQPNEQSYLNILTITYISLYIRRERELLLCWTAQFKKCCFCPHTHLFVTL